MNPDQAGIGEEISILIRKLPGSILLAIKSLQEHKQKRRRDNKRCDWQEAI